MINIRKLVALDITLHGYTFIISEFLFGVMAAFIIGILSLRFQPYLGYYIISLGINYIPLLLFSIDMKMKNSAKKEAKGELKRVYTYTAQQFVIFIPFSMILLVLLQYND